MLKKLSKLITNNFGLKVLATVFAIVLWLVVVNTEDPEKTKGFSVPVKIENESYLTDMGKTYEVLGNSDWISIRVTGRRSIINQLSESDFVAVANMENINEDLTMIPVTVSAARYESQLEISRRDAYLNVNVENLITQQFDIRTVTEGTPGELCYVDGVRVSPEKVEVTGPESIINQIAGAQVVVNVDQAYVDIAANSEIVLLDEAGNVIPQTRLTLNRTTAAVDVAILMEKTVPVEFETTGDPAAGYRFAGLDGAVSELTVSGPSDIVEGIDNLKISPPQLNLTGATENLKTKVRFADYLPEGVSVAQGEPEEAEITARIEGQNTQAFELPVANITVQNLADGLELQFDTDTVTVNLKGFADELEKLSASDLKGTLDASTLSEGKQLAIIQLQGDYKAADTVRAAVTVTAASETQDGEEAPPEDAAQDETGTE